MLPGGELMNGSSLSKTFGPSRFRWFRKLGNTTSADFCEHEPSHLGRPAFRASSTHGYASQISPNKNVNLSLHKLPIYLRSVFRWTASCDRHTHLEPSASYVVSVRHLAGLGESAAETELLLA